MSLDTTSHDVPVARTIFDMRELVVGWHSAGEKVALVPTMGALHAGHLSLIQVARDKGATKIIVSIFVNPTQFGPGEDYEAYPRTETSDAEKLVGQADLIFAPNAAQMYPTGYATTISVSGVTNTLEGEARPTHFDGVATIVAKLLIAAQADCAVFGEKDYQQLLTIRQMTRDLALPVEILGGPILREPDGLAMSSRNVYLTPDERVSAGQLNVILRETATAVARGADISSATKKAKARLIDLGFSQVDYLTVRDTETLAPIDTITKPARILVAAKIGKPRLLDNMAVERTYDNSGLRDSLVDVLNRKEKWVESISDYIKKLNTATSEQKALKIFENLQEERKNSPYYFLEASDYFRKQWNNTKKAEDLLHFVSEKFPQDVSALKALAFRYEEYGQFEKALKIHLKILKLRSRAAQSHRNVANA